MPPGRQTPITLGTARSSCGNYESCPCVIAGSCFGLMYRSASPFNLPVPALQGGGGGGQQPEHDTVDGGGTLDRVLAEIGNRQKNDDVENHAGFGRLLRH